jgi:hypothetical protein
MAVPRSQASTNAPSPARHPQRAAHRLDLSASAPPLCARHEQRLADGEQADGQRRHLDAVEQFRHAEGQPRLAGQLVDADQPERQADEQRGQPAQGESPKAPRR